MKGRPWHSHASCHSSCYQALCVTVRPLTASSHALVLMRWSATSIRHLLLHRRLQLRQQVLPLFLLLGFVYVSTTLQAWWPGIAPAQQKVLSVSCLCQGQTPTASASSCILSGNGSLEKWLGTFRLAVLPVSSASASAANHNHCHLLQLTKSKLSCMQVVVLQSVANNVMNGRETDFDCTALKGITAGQILYRYTRHHLPDPWHHNVQLSCFQCDGKSSVPDVRRK